MRAAFPKAVVARLDAQALANKASRDRVLQDYADRRTNILVGTQLLAKGLDFINTTCIGVIHADLTLNLPDFRSAERCFQLMVQVAGRAGRDNKPSTVFIQTYQKGHYAFADACQQNVHQFFLDEMAFRKQWLYPPVVRLCRVIVSDFDANDVEKSMRSIYNYIVRLPIRKEVIGPSYAPLAKKEQPLSHAPHRQNNRGGGRAIADAPVPQRPAVDAFEKFHPGPHRHRPGKYFLILKGEHNG
mgnify:CR=1 FL=1